MALTRAMLRGMNLNEEQVSAIIEAHADTVDALKEQRDEYKKSAETTKTELDSIKQSGGDWEKRYNDEHEAYEAYKSEQTAKEMKIAKETAFTSLAKQSGVSEKLIPLLVKASASDIESLELNEDGTAKEAEAILTKMKADWAGYIVTEQTSGAQTAKPAENSGAVRYTDKADIMKIADRDARRQAIKENPQLFQ